MSARVLFNAGGAGAGGGGTYVLAVARELARGGTRGLQWRFLVAERLVTHLEDGPIEVAQLPPAGAARRILWEQAALARRRGEALVAAGGFGPVARPDSFVLVAHNALLYDRLEVGGAAELRLRAETALAGLSARRARAVIAPSDTMARLVGRVRGRPVLASPFGPGLAEGRTSAPDGRFTFLHRTHWGPHKELSTLLRAIRRLGERFGGRFVVRSACDPRTSFARRFRSSAEERALLGDPVVAAHFEMAAYSLGSVEQRTLAGDAVVVPSGIESFSFPLAEALAFGVPIAAADRPYAWELCGQAAFYVPLGSDELLASTMERLIEGDRPQPPDRCRLARLSWPRHVDALAEAARRLALP